MVLINALVVIIGTATLPTLTQGAAFLSSLSFQSVSSSRPLASSLFSYNPYQEQQPPPQQRQQQQAYNNNPPPHYDPNYNYSPNPNNYYYYNHNNNNNNNDNYVPPTTITTKTETTSTGEADRAFQAALSFEKAGQTRSAHAHFHSAATLYQCYLDSIITSTTSKSSSTTTTTSSSTSTQFRSYEFAHVTTLSSPNSCRNALAYACSRLAFLSHDSLGDPRAAARLFKDAIQKSVKAGGSGSHGNTDSSITDNNNAVAQTLNNAAEAYDGMGMSIEASTSSYGSSSTKNLQKAIETYRKGLQLGGGSSGYILFHLAVALERLASSSPEQESEDNTSTKNNNDGSSSIGGGGNTLTNPMAIESEEIMEQLRRDDAKYACLVDSWGYIRWHTRKVPNQDLNLYLGTRSMLKIGIEAAMPLITQLNDDNMNGLVCEFGVATGRSLRMMQEILPLQITLHGFDTFMGLPMAWGDEPAGAYSTGGVLPNLQGEVYFHRGLFVDTIPRFLEEVDREQGSSSSTNNDSSSGSTVEEDNNNYQPLAFANIDCDLYGSTLNILEAMHSRVVPGTVLVFDEYLCHPTWRQDEFRAWRECCKRFGWQYEYLGFSLFTKQAVVRVTSA